MYRSLLGLAPLFLLACGGPTSGDYLFEVVVDYGAYRDIQRHRLAGQYPQPLTAVCTLPSY